MASENVTEVTAETFDKEVIQSEVPVLVDFWAEWCSPCRMLAPTIEKLAKDYAGKVKVAKADVEVNHDASMKYRVQNIPTVIIFKDGQPVRTFVGIRSERDYREALDTL